MSRVLILASQATRTARHAGLLQSAVVGGCALALILARFPLGF